MKGYKIILPAIIMILAAIGIYLRLHNGLLAGDFYRGAQPRPVLLSGNFILLIAAAFLLVFFYLQHSEKSIRKQQVLAPDSTISKQKQNFSISSLVELAAQIDILLWTEWDPIGVNEFDEARDEYQAYISPITALVTSGSSQQQIQDFLYQTETVRMGLIGNKDNCSRVATLLIALRFHPS